MTREEHWSNIDQDVRSRGLFGSRFELQEYSIKFGSDSCALVGAYYFSREGMKKRIAETRLFQYRQERNQWALVQTYEVPDIWPSYYILASECVITYANRDGGIEWSSFASGGPSESGMLFGRTNPSSVVDDTVNLDAVYYSGAHSFGKDGKERQCVVLALSRIALKKLQRGELLWKLPQLQTLEIMHRYVRSLRGVLDALRNQRDIAPDLQQYLRTYCEEALTAIESLSTLPSAAQELGKVRVWLADQGLL